MPNKERRDGYIDLNKQVGKLVGTVEGLVKSSEKQGVQLNTAITRLEDRAEKSFIKTDRVLQDAPGS